MKLISFEHAGRRSFGAVSSNGVLGEGVVDLGDAMRQRGIASLRELIAADLIEEAGRLAADSQPSHRLGELTLLPVIPDPGKIICVGLNYRDHVAETGRTVTEKPTLFARYAASQVGHLQPMLRPPESTEFDYEGELAVVIGRGGRRIAESQALAAVAGYACYNEGSIRDWQRHTSQFLPGKTFAGTGAFGPWLVTADEVPDPARLTLETRVNGAVVQHTTTDLMITPIPALIAYCSTILPLEPGDVIVTGTPGGVGAKRNPPLWLKPGDSVEVEISGIGCLRNPIMDEAQ